MRKAWTEQLRRVAVELSQGGKKEVSTLALCAAVGAEDEATKAKVRRSVWHMVNRGELVRVRPGVFTAKPNRMVMMERNGMSYRRMWLIMRTERAGWTIAAIAATTRLHNSTVNKYCLWLLGEGFLVQCGKKGNERLFRVTAKGVDHVETPFPPVTEKDPFVRERNAAARLARVFMEPDPARHSEKIVQECQVILARFSSRNENFDGFAGMESAQLEKKSQKKGEKA
jgi:hypothetical protein